MVQIEESKILSVDKVLDLIFNKPEEEIIVHYLKDDEKPEKLTLDENMFMVQDIGSEFKYFIIGKEKICNCEFEVKKAGELKYWIKPKLIKSKAVPYGSDIVLRLDFYCQECIKETIEKLLKIGFAFTNGDIRIAKSKDKKEGKEIYFLLFENIESPLVFFKVLDDASEEGTLDYKIYYEYLPKRKIGGKIFVQDGYKPILFDKLYNEKGLVVIIDDENTIYSNIEKGLFENKLTFEKIYKFIDLKLKNNPIFLNSISKNTNFSIFLRLLKERKITEEYNKLKEKKKKLSKELRIVNQMIDKLKNLDNNMAGFIVEEDNLNELYYLFEIYSYEKDNYIKTNSDKEILDSIKVFQFLIRDKEYGERKRFFFVYGPEIFLPLDNFFSFSEAPEWRVGNFRTLIPTGYKLVPNVNFKDFPELFDKFLSSILPEDIEIEKVKNGDYFLILDDSGRYFDSQGVFVEVDKGISFYEFFKKYAKLEIPVGDGENDYFAVNRINKMQRKEYIVELENNVEEFYSTLVKDVENEVNNVIEEWNKTLAVIKTESFNFHKLVDIFKEDLENLKKSLSDYFNDKSIINFLNSIINNIKRFNKELYDRFSNPEIEELKNKQYKDLKTKYESFLNDFSKLEKNIQSFSENYSTKYKNLFEHFEKLENKLDKFIEDYNNSEKKLINFLKKVDSDDKS